MTTPRTIDSDVGLLHFWGSECGSCGNTTPDSMKCEECDSGAATNSLWEFRR